MKANRLFCLMKAPRIIAAVKRLLCVSVCVLIFSVALSDRLWAKERKRGESRVIVLFEARADESLIGAYGGRVVRVFRGNDALVCTILERNIDALRDEGAVKDVVKDILIQPQESKRKRDPEELALFLSLKKQYFRNIQRDYHSLLQEARQELMSSIRKVHQKRKRHYDVLRSALQEYRKKIASARKAYVSAIRSWRESVDKMMPATQDGDLAVRWNNLETGLNAAAGWEKYNVDGAGVKIAFLDTGVNYRLPDLANNYLEGIDYVDNDNDPLTTDPSEFHGTEVVSLAVAEGVDPASGGKVKGVAPHASYYAVRVADSKGAFLSDLISGIEWASTEPHQADIILISAAYAGAGDAWNALKPLLEEAINRAYEKNITIIAGSGDDGATSASFPAAFDKVIAVGAYGEDPQTVSEFSNADALFVAPGEALPVIDPHNALYRDSGTSFAASQAAGLVALQIHRTYQKEVEVNNVYHKEVMLFSAVDLGETALYQGRGKIWAAESVQEPLICHKGTLDYMSNSIFPLEYSIDYYNYAYLTPEGYPAYYIGRTMYQDITITNVTANGDDPLVFETLEVTATQVYEDTGEQLPGDSYAEFGPVTLGYTSPDNTIVFPNEYFIPLSAMPGLDKVILTVNIIFEGGQSGIYIRDRNAGLWCPPAEINE